MTAEKLNVLIVEDDEADAELACIALESSGFELVWRRVDTADGLRRALDEERWDVVISDFAMPGFDGLNAFAIFLERRLDIPFIFVSGALGEERAVEAMRAGANDYLLKGHLGRLAVAIRRELRAARNRRQRTTAEESSRRHQRRLALAVEASGAGVFEANLPLDDETFVGERCAEMLGVRLIDWPTPQALPAWISTRVHIDDLGPLTAAWEAFVTGASDALAHELRVRHESGRVLEVDVRIKAVERDDGGRAARLVGVMLDVTDRKQLEMHARQSQKMDAIGRLAGGVAHDFNNLLTAIFSFGSFVLDGLRGDDPVRADMEEVMRAAHRAAGLTNQLLAFSRMRRTSVKVVVVREIIDALQRMLGRLLGEDVDIKVRHDPRDPRVHIDPAELEQVLVNLAVNARDAMPRGGKLTIETELATLGDQFPDHAGPRVPPGDYTMIAVSDTGVGMDTATMARVFEPFFTTKEPGRGTGLGLATCYGIVQRMGGFIWVYSEPGRGSTFKVFLPRFDAAEPAPASPASPEPSVAPRGLILVVEDDVQVRAPAVRTLERLGYTVVQASDGAAALALAATVNEPIDLLLTDVVMPGMSGRELADELTAARPGLRVLFMSGFAPLAVMHRGELDPDARMIQKPFTPDMLARAVALALSEEATLAAERAPG